MEDLYYYWFSNKKIWFNASSQDDENISNLFLDLYLKKENIEFNFNNKELGISIILLYDQIVRHLVRNDSIDEINIKLDNEKIIHYVYEFYSHYKNEFNCNEFCFVMLPLRHTNKFNHYKFVLYQTWNKLLNCKTEKEKKIYKNFLTVSYKKCPIKDLLLLNNKKEKLELKDFYIKYKYILDLKQRTKGNVIKINDNINDNILKNNNIILSISGGVDSNVLSYLFRKMELENVVLVHINYNNRESCNDEVRFLEDWSNYLNYKLYIRNIYEINRENCMIHNLRNVYEDYTQKVRYNFYKQVAEDLGWKDYYVVLGHNKDDCFENILTNISKKQKYENLTGMELLSNIDNINFYRPLLNITKEDIYKTASNYNIPHLVDSTPLWSQRGIIRDNVLPVLNEWNHSFIDGLFELNTIIKDNYELIVNTVDLIIEKIEVLYQNDYEYIYKFVKKNFVNNSMFWKIFFHKLNIQISNKSIQNLIYNYKKDDINQKSNLELSKSFRMIINKDNIFICKK